jgi:orotidine-5'-phosphate decarboxylase
LERAKLAQVSGLDGVVASAQEAGMLRKELGPDFVIVTPGIRPADADAGDQKRVETPASAIKSGSSFLVVGRPIVKAKDPQAAARAILAEILTAL